MADFPGIWMTESESMAYRVVPKAACSTIGQIMFFSDHGRFYDGDIHDATEGIHKWVLEPSQPVIRATIEARRAFTFSAVRNPYARVLSAFLDKICGIQRSGNRYRPDMAEKIRRAYGVEVEGDFDQIAAFRRFLLLARDTIRWKKPFWPDIHWAPQSNHIATLVRGGGGSITSFTPRRSTPACRSCSSARRCATGSTSPPSRASTRARGWGRGGRIRSRPISTIWGIS